MEDFYHGNWGFPSVLLICPFFDGMSVDFGGFWPPLVGANLHEIFGMLPIFRQSGLLSWRFWIWFLGDVLEKVLGFKDFQKRILALAGRLVGFVMHG